MAQGAIKKKPKSTGTSAKPSSILAPKKGARTIAPKKKKLVAQNKITKKYSAGLMARTERSLAEKAGHLEMLAGGKKGGAKGATGKKS